MTLLVSRDAHQSVVAGLIFSGVQPRWIPPHWDADLHLTHAPSPAAVEDAWNQYSGAAGALAVSPTPLRHGRRPYRDRCNLPPRGNARVGVAVAGRLIRVAGSLWNRRRQTDLRARGEMGRAPVRFFL